MKKFKVTVLSSLLCIISLSAQNLVDVNDWIDGETGRTNKYQLQGVASQNSRVTMMGPYGENMVVWQALADGSSSFNGGFSESGVFLDTSKSYRISFWVRSSGVNDCPNYIGFTPYDTAGNLVQPFTNENGGTSNWPYFSTRALPDDNWYLIVGYIRPNNTNDIGNSGIYNPMEGTMSNLPSVLYNTVDYTFPSNLTQLFVRIRAFMWACGTGERMYIASPRLEEINGQEASLSELLYGQNSTDGNPDGNPDGNIGSVWSESNSVATYFGKVGIGTTTPGNYELAVNGEIRAKEIKVETANWPDYVFKDNHSLPSLKEVATHIKEKGHLLNIPSAKEVEANGIELGEMNRLLLEKIEELTLYILKQEERIVILENQK